MSINLYHKYIAAIVYILFTVSLIEAAPQPKFSLLPISPTTATIYQYATLDVAYLVTNNTAVARTLTMMPIKGVSQNIDVRNCAQPFTLPPQGQCVLSLTIRGAKLTSPLTGGPKICKTQGPTDNSPDPFLCSQPATSDRLLITLSSAQLSSLTISPTNVILPNGVNQQFTAIGTYSDGVIQYLTEEVLWLSSNPTSTLISNLFYTKGLAQSISGGHSIITASLGTTFASAQMWVTAGTLQSISITPADSTLTDNTSQQFTATGHYSDNSDIDITHLVAWASSDLQVAHIATGGLASREAQIGGATGISATLNGISSSTSLTVPAIVYAYLTSAENNMIIKCPINTDGRFGLCSIAGSGFNSPLSVTFNCPGTIAYIMNSGNATASMCTVQPNGNLSACTQTGGFNSPAASTIDYADTWLYISNQGTHALLTCPLDPTTGTIGTCTSSAAGGEPTGITLNRAGDFIYVANRNANTLSFCPVTVAGQLGSCSATGPAVNNAIDVALNAAGTFAYILDHNSIKQCAIDSLTGELSASCVSSYGSSTLASIVINDEDSFAYSTDFATSRVNLCPLNETTGALEACTALVGDFIAPHSITLHNAAPSQNCPG